MRKKIIFLVCVCSFTAFLFLVQGCGTTSTADGIKRQEKQEDDDFKKMFPKDDPLNHIADIRQYALDNLDLDDDSCIIIMNTAPKIKHDGNTMEYCFFWAIPEKRKIVEVVTTPPPACDPMIARISDKVSYIY